MKTTKYGKKIICAVLTGGLLLGCLSGCGDKEKVETPEASAPAEEVVCN